MQSAQSLNRVNLVPRALFRHLQCQGKAPWGRSWNRVFIFVFFSFDRVFKKKTEARPCLTKAMFRPCWKAFRADTKSSQNFALGFFAFNQGLTPQFLLSYCHFLSNKSCLFLFSAGATKANSLGRA